jgi:hypothetical protein
MDPLVLADEAEDLLLAQGKRSVHLNHGSLEHTADSPARTIL